MLRDVDVIVWDEISMQTRYAVECVDRLLRDVAAPDNRSQPFGGVVMVFGGDWCQFLPVIPGATKVDTIHATLKLSALWDSMQVLVLDENMRLYPGEEDHAAWLRAVGEGRNLKGDGSIDIPTEMCMESEEDVIKWMYSEEVLRSPQLMGKMALLTVRNCDALELNEKVLNMTSGDLIEIYAIDTPLTEEEGTVGMPCEDEEFLHDLTPPGMPESIISYTSMDSFEFSVHYSDSPLTSEDKQVLKVAEEAKKSDDKRAFLLNWLKENEKIWLNSNERKAHIRRKERIRKEREENEKQEKKKSGEAN
ncbi:unnamed protein product [Cylicocyclus nassatus]|uniref:ATP-dependent DNA helicase n=1 Tax=Cylicocyclus nassatus TaxID=53992 RepID=A0AA36M848_CYLNA|nr:unnamed protein product [Cylicocyclus nassatus]